MYFKQEPLEELKSIINCFWSIDKGLESTIETQKIIPDGFPEMIFHYGDNFHININGRWEKQSKHIIAGQISNYFYLKNSGTSRMFAIKFQPWALSLLFGINMKNLTNKVIQIPKSINETLAIVSSVAISDLSFQEKVNQIQSWFFEYYNSLNLNLSTKEEIVRYIIAKNGHTNMQGLEDQFSISARSIERYFASYIGLSPKFYTRVIRFSYVFNVINQPNKDWQDVVFEAGYYDQSHFIKNFKEFTGEEPSKYGFSEINMANFFLKK